MIGRAVALLFALLSLTASPGLYAVPQTPAASSAAGDRAAVQVSRETVQQKLQLVKMLLTKSSTVERAASSNDAAVKQNAADTLALYAKANNAFEAGDMPGTEQLLNEVLRLITDASRLAPDPAKVEAEQRARYEELLDNVRGIQITYHEMRKNMSPKDKQMPVVTANLERNIRLIDKAQSLAQGKQYKEAIDLLDKGYTAGVSDLNKLMDSVTTTYELKFNSPADEFDHELARYRSYEELVPIAHAELKPAEGNIKLSDRYVQEGRAARDLAKQQAAGGDYRIAIGTLQEATKRMQTALRTLGLTVPE